MFLLPHPRLTLWHSVCSWATLSHSSRQTLWCSSNHLPRNLLREETYLLLDTKYFFHALNWYDISIHHKSDILINITQEREMLLISDEFCKIKKIIGSPFGSVTHLWVLHIWEWNLTLSFCTSVFAKVWATEISIGSALFTNQNLKYIQLLRNRAWFLF